MRFIITTFLIVFISLAFGQKIEVDSITKGVIDSLEQLTTRIELYQITPTEVTYGKRNQYSDFRQLSVLIEDSVDYTRVKYLSALSIEDKKHFFNTLSENIGRDLMQTKCYEPRHGILLRSKQEVIGVFEICFECSRIKSTFGSNIKIHNNILVEWAKYFNP